VDSVIAKSRGRDGRSAVALRPPRGLGRLRSRQRDRGEPWGRGGLFGSPRCRFQPQLKISASMDVLQALHLRFNPLTIP